jgi:hypothetical protein
MDHMAIAENNADIMFFSVGSDLFKSIDGGVTVSAINSTTLPNHTINDIAFDPKDDNTIILAYGQHQDNNSRLFITQDGGTTWSNISYNLSSMPARSVVIDHTQQKNIYVGCEIGVYTMPMGSTNYTLLGNGFPNVTARELEIVWATNTLRAATWGRGLWEHPLVNRSAYPRITKVETSVPVTLETPTNGSTFSVTADIVGNISDAYLKYSVNGIELDQTLDMLSLPKGKYFADGNLPTASDGDRVYFRLYAVSTNNDTTETYRYMYTVRDRGDYCTAQGSSGTGSDYINYVALNGTTNNSGQDYYGDFTNITIPLQTNSTYTIDVGLNQHWDPDTVYAWIDFDNNHIFDESETIYFDQIDNAHQTAATFTVPNEAYVGDVRLRVRSMYWDSSPIACGSETGEVEDYTINITKGCDKYAVVSNVNDSGSRTLRQLLTSVCESDTVYIDVALSEDTLVLTSGALSLVGSKEVVNLGEGSFYISGDNQFNTFTVDMVDTLMLQKINLINGFDNNHGGAIYNQGMLILDQVEIKDNTTGNPPTSLSIKNEGTMIIRNGSATKIMD